MDYISNLLTSIRNAEMASHSHLEVPHSKVGMHILTILKKNNYITDFSESKSEKTGHPSIVITLPQPVARRHYKRISKPGRRVYTDAKNIPLVLRGLGMVIISTSEGIMSGQDAKKRNIGGELLCELY